MISELARLALTTPQEPPSVKQPKAVYGLRPFARRGGVVTNDFVQLALNLESIVVRHFAAAAHEHIGETFWLALLHWQGHRDVTPPSNTQGCGAHQNQSGFARLK